MATFADAGRIDTQTVASELHRLQQRHSLQVSAHSHSDTFDDGLEQAGLQISHPDWQGLQEQLDPFDRVQLAYVIQIAGKCRQPQKRGAISMRRVGRKSA